MPCKGAKEHCALDKHCPAQVNNDKRAKKAYSARPQQFGVAAAYNEPHLSIPATITPMEIDQSQQDETQDNEFRVIAKRRRGQPTALSQMSTIDIANIATFFSGPTVEFRRTPELQALFPRISTPGSL